METSARATAGTAPGPGGWTAHPLTELPDRTRPGRWTLAGRSPDLAMLAPGAIGLRLFGWGGAIVLEARGGQARLLDGQGRELERLTASGPLQAASRLWQRWSRRNVLDLGQPPLRAIGAFAFDMERDPRGAWAGVPPLRLTVPIAAVVEEQGQAWLITPDQHSMGPQQLRFRPQPGPEPDADPPVGPLAADWSREVNSALATIRDRGLRKVVLAQEYILPTAHRLDAELAMERMRRGAPETWSFRVPAGPGQVFLGSSPELLLKRSARELESWPLAGTMALDGDDPAEVGRRLFGSDKDMREHRAVVDQVTAAMGHYCRELTYPRQPEPVLFPGMIHLGTRITGTVRDGASAPVLEVLAGLHPTPAVGGVPSGDALAVIRELESFDRGWYAGGAGWVGSDGTGEFALAIRSMLMSATEARIFAGNGIVAGSDPAIERAEVELKLRSVLRPLFRSSAEAPERGSDGAAQSTAPLGTAGGRESH